MKTLFYSILAIGALTLITVAHAEKQMMSAAPAKEDSTKSQFPGADAPPVVREEYRKMNLDLQQQLAAAKNKLADLEAQKTRAFAQVQTIAQAEKEAVRLFDEYASLLKAKYVGENGDFKSGAELTAKEVENINKLFSSYLWSTPLKGRVSAGFAQRTLETGIERLQDQIKAHTSPSESNNSEFEIIAQQRRDLETQMKRINETAERLGMRLNEPIQIAEPTTGASPARAPASSAK